MKLCQLLHEARHTCPTCGGDTDDLGRSAPAQRRLSFPNKEGIWNTSGGPKTREQLDAESGDRPLGWKTEIGRPDPEDVDYTKKFNRS